MTILISVLGFAEYEIRHGLLCGFILYCSCIDAANFFIHQFKTRRLIHAIGLARVLHTWYVAINSALHHTQ